MNKKKLLTFGMITAIPLAIASFSITDLGQVTLQNAKNVVEELLSSGDQLDSLPLNAKFKALQLQLDDIKNNTSSSQGYPVGVLKFVSEKDTYIVPTSKLDDLTITAFGDSLTDPNPANGMYFGMDIEITSSPVNFQDDINACLTNGFGYNLEKSECVNNFSLQKFHVGGATYSILEKNIRTNCTDTTTGDNLFASIFPNPSDIECNWYSLGETVGGDSAYRLLADNGIFFLPLTAEYELTGFTENINDLQVNLLVKGKDAPSATTKEECLDSGYIWKESGNSSGCANLHTLHIRDMDGAVTTSASYSEFEHLLRSSCNKVTKPDQFNGEIVDSFLINTSPLFNSNNEYLDCNISGMDIKAIDYSNDIVISDVDERFFIAKEYANNLELRSPTQDMPSGQFEGSLVLRGVENNDVFSYGDKSSCMQNGGIWTESGMSFGCSNRVYFNDNDNFSMAANTQLKQSIVANCTETRLEDQQGTVNSNKVYENGTNFFSTSTDKYYSCDFSKIGKSFDDSIVGEEVYLKVGSEDVFVNSKSLSYLELRNPSFGPTSSGVLLIKGVKDGDLMPPFGETKENCINAEGIWVESSGFPGYCTSTYNYSFSEMNSPYEQSLDTNCTVSYSAFNPGSGLYELYEKESFSSNKSFLNDKAIYCDWNQIFGEYTPPSTGGGSGSSGDTMTYYDAGMGTNVTIGLPISYSMVDRSLNNFTTPAQELVNLSTGLVIDQNSCINLGGSWDSFNYHCIATASQCINNGYIYLQADSDPILMVGGCRSDHVMIGELTQDMDPMSSNFGFEFYPTQDPSHPAGKIVESCTSSSNGSLKQYYLFDGNSGPVTGVTCSFSSGGSGGSSSGGNYQVDYVDFWGNSISISIPSSINLEAEKSVDTNGALWKSSINIYAKGKSDPMIDQNACISIGGSWDGWCDMTQVTKENCLSGGYIHYQDQFASFCQNVVEFNGLDTMDSNHPLFKLDNNCTSNGQQLLNFAYEDFNFPPITRLTNVSCSWDQIGTPIP